VLEDGKKKYIFFAEGEGWGLRKRRLGRERVTLSREVHFQR